MKTTKKRAPNGAAISRNYPRTIAEELHNAWKILRRRGDPELMAETLQYSRPVIDHALIYGYVTFSELPDKINKFFRDRIERERRQAADLLKAQAQAAQELSQLNNHNPKKGKK